MFLIRNTSIVIDFKRIKYGDYLIKEHENHNEEKREGINKDKKIYFASFSHAVATTFPKLIKKEVDKNL